MTVVRPTSTGVDRHNDPIVGAPQRIEIPGCIVAPAGTNDERDDAKGVSTSPTVFAPFGSGILPTDQLDVDGVIYDIDGAPKAWLSPFTRRRCGDEITLRRIDG